MALGVYLRWKRIPTFPVNLQEQAKRGTFRFAWLVGFLTLVVMDMIKLPAR